MYTMKRLILCLLFVFQSFYLGNFVTEVPENTSVERECSFFNATTMKPLTRDGKADKEPVKTKPVFPIVLPPDLIRMIRREEIKEEAKIKCESLNGTYMDRREECLIPIVQLNGAMKCTTTLLIRDVIYLGNVTIDQTLEYRLTIAGNAFSQMSLVLLLGTYIWDKELHTSYGKCIIFLSASTMLEQIIQMISLNAREEQDMCTVLALLHHWVYLVMFLWMGSIAFDLLVTFSRIRQPSRAEQRRRFKIYATVSIAAPSLIVGSCVVINFCTENYLIGYGHSHICFITNYKANLIAFAIPVAAILLFNMACLVTTLLLICKARSQTKSVLRPNSNRRRGHISIIIMTLKLSFLLGMSWVFGLLGRLTRSVPLLYVYIFCSSFQGVFIFIAFCVNSKVLSFYRSKIHRSAPKLNVGLRQNHIQDTHL